MTKVRWSKLSLIVLLVSILLVGCGTNSKNTATPASDSKEAENPTEEKLNYPEKNIDLIVPFNAGGGIDMVGRMIADLSPKYVGGTMVVINRAGASGSIGTVEGAKAKPDGYTLTLTGGTNLVVHPHLKPMQYSLDDFKIISHVTYNPVLLVVKDSSPYNSINDIVEDVKKNNTSLKFGHSSVGGAVDMANSAFSGAVGMNGIKVPFKSNGEVTAALLGGHIDITSLYTNDVQEYVKDKKIKVLGVYLPERLDIYPDVPTIGEGLKEAGIDFKYDNTDFSAGFFLTAPKDTPEEIAAHLSESIKAALEDPEFIEKAKSMNLFIRNLGGNDAMQQLKDMETSYKSMIEEYDIKE